MTASQPTLLKIMVSPIARSGRVHICQQTLIQSYLDDIYLPFAEDIKQSLYFYDNEHYGEIYYYSVVKLVKYLNISNTDHVLDLGSGLGRVAFQLFLTTNAASITGIEINAQRYDVSKKVNDVLETTTPDVVVKARALNLIHGDFLKYHFDDISVIYVCSYVFSFELLEAMGKKINGMSSVKKIASIGKLPHLVDFKLIKTVFLHCTWDRVACYIYERINEK